MSCSSSDTYSVINPPGHKELAPKLMPDQLSQLLYVARWLGMLLVLGVHATAAFMNFNELTPANTPIFTGVWRFIVSYPYGRQAVIGFFVMSGFLVGGQVLTRLNSDKPFLRDYIIHRIVRIYMVVIPAIFFTFLFDAIGRSMFPVNYGAYPIFDGHYDPRYILTNLLNLQGVIATHYGSNGALWSVGYEFWYYIIFPLLLAPLIASIDKNKAGIYAALAALFCIAISVRQIWFPFGFTLWSLGALISLSGKPLISSKLLSFVLFLLIGLFLGAVIDTDAVHAHPWMQYISDAVSAIAFANLILTMRFSDGTGWRILDWSGHKTLADFSFTLYSIHNPTLMLLRATATAVLGPGWTTGAASPVQWAAMATSMALAILLAYTLSRFTEGKVGEARRLARLALLRIWPDPAVSDSVSPR